MTGRALADIFIKFLNHKKVYLNEVVRILTGHPVHIPALYTIYLSSKKITLSSDRGLYSVPINSPPACRQVLPPITLKKNVFGNNTCFITFLKYVNTFNHFEMVWKKQKGTVNCEMG
jgi:hypothetical protein